MPLAAMWAALLAGALAAVLTGALWLLVVGVVLSILVPRALRARGRRGYRRLGAWIVGVILALLIVWVVMIGIAAATGEIE